MYKLDLAEILKTTISMELYPVKMGVVHDLVTLTCIHWNEQANKSLRQPEDFLSVWLNVSYHIINQVIQINCGRIYMGPFVCLV